MTSADDSLLARTSQQGTADSGAEITQAGRDVHKSTHVHEAPAPARPSVIRGLRRDALHFTGRNDELQRLLHSSAAGQASIYAVNGMPGVGKTAFVTRAAHLVADQFPDGQFFVDLRAHAPGQAAADPVDVLATLLVGLGIDPGSLPANLEGRSGLWRDHLAGRRVLLVLDDAADSSQVEPLLPGAAGCLILVTSRARLVDLDDSEPLPLPTLPHGEAVTLFDRLAHRRPHGAGSEPGDLSDSAVADDIVELCGRLPLAIVLLASRLAHRPTWTVADLAADFMATTDFTDTPDRLRHLAAGTRAVDVAFTLSYRDLPPARKRLFRRLGLHPGPDIDPHAAAALDGVSPAQARDGLDALYTDHLLEEIAPRRYTLHNLLREYAASCCTSHDPAEERDLALARLMAYYERTVTAAEEIISAHRSSTPLLADASSALNWLRLEHANVLACLDHAAAHDQPEHVVELTRALAPFLLREGWPHVAALHERAAKTARRIRDFHSEAGALEALGFVRYVTGDYAAAIGFHERALALFEELGDRHGQAAVLNNLGRVRYMTADYATATQFNERALSLFDALGDRRGQSSVLLSLGFISYMTGDYRAASDRHERALALFEDIGDRHGQADALQDLGRVRFVTGNYQAASELHERALVLFEELGDRHGQANGLNNLGRVRFMTGNYRTASELHE
ncbi:ATP-binding protein [Streptomyces sp. NPDC055210]